MHFENSIVDGGLLTDAASIHALEKKKPATVISKNNTGGRALSTAIPVFNNDGSIWRIVANVRDITDLTRIERKLEETRERARHYREEPTDYEIVPLKKARDELERKLIESALSRYGSTYRTADALGVAQPTVVRKAQKYGIKIS